ncbi:MAG: homoprotocatechuate degradation operon regulator HpaR [Thioclava marina]|uniref:homoprotocatechuate degradation operon regulator HpaR n=1 Tax=Thioclava marina TaxID=1915077 RepID=UPI00198CDB81|nr:homoprotocatechuate degradation operon regulator HpaR [Thioclava marina]MBC7146738.1 homoprotocatechuate degradation operon regulator HpaR [Thioclava marina]
MTQDSAPRQRPDGFELNAPRRSLPIALLRARELVMERFRPMLNAHDVTEQQWRVLRVLRESGPLDASMLAERACVLAPSLTRMLRALETRGLIEIRRDGEDRRRASVGLSEAGTAFLRDVSPQSAEIYAKLEAEIGAERITRLLDELEAFVAALEHDDRA